MPTVYQLPEFTVAGGLASYGGNLTDALRVAGLYSGRILKGKKPADLPIQQATKIELILNLKTAGALGPVAAYPSRPSLGALMSPQLEARMG